MRHLVVFLAAVLWAMPVLAETKKAPDGFGPIKFGMTIEEAWEAAGRDGSPKDIEGDTLFSYTLKVPKSKFRLTDFEVSQYFTDGRASSALVRSEFESVTYSRCFEVMSRIIGFLSYRYDKTPQNLQFFVQDGFDRRETYSNLYFENGSSITAILRYVKFSHEKQLKDMDLVKRELFGDTESPSYLEALPPNCQFVFLYEGPSSVAGEEHKALLRLF